MKIIVLGNDTICLEAKQKLLSLPVADRLQIQINSLEDVPHAHLIIDTTTHSEGSTNNFFFEQYAHLPVTVLAAAVMQPIHQFLAQQKPKILQEMKCNLFGFNTLPTFINLPLWEISVPYLQTEAVLEQTLKPLAINYKTVADQAGMVTPRIIAQIINEAYYTVMEQTATPPHINTAMKLGTNYPYGPFEWAERIGIQNIYLILNAMLQNFSHNPRYKICPLLQQQYYQFMAKQKMCNTQK